MPMTHAGETVRSEGRSETKMVGRQGQLRRTNGGAQADSAAVAPPCAMVIFGADGDLTKRLIVPALYNLVKAKRLSNGFQLVGVDLAAKTAEEWRKGLTDTMQQFVAHDGEFRVDHIDQTAWGWLTDRMSYLQGDLNDPGTYRRLGEHLAGLDKTAGTAGNHLFYLAVADRFFSVAVAGLGAAGLVTEERRPMAPGSDRKAFRPRPALGQSAQCRDPEDAAGASDLPDGPFPRQGNGPEHHGVALCQRSVRAAVEPAAHRPRPDHRGGDRRGRAPRQVLREDRGAARHGAQPRLPAAGDDRHGAAHLVRCRCGPGQEGGGSGGRTAIHSPGGR